MTTPRKDTNTRTAGPWLWPVVFVVTGVFLLLDNFLLLGDFNAYTLLPLLLVIAGAQVLLRGDLVPSGDVRTFGITRGSVESGTLEINSGEIDLSIRALQREGRLLAGQFAANSRPDLQVEDNYAHLRMTRGNTPWYSFADWHIAVARDLPWQILASTHIGKVELDLEGLIVHDVVAGTGFGEIRFTAPQEALGQIFLRSTLGNIYVTTPYGYNTQIVIEGSRFLDLQVDSERYEVTNNGSYLSLDADPDAPLIEIRISGTFSDVYLA